MRDDRSALHFIKRLSDAKRCYGCHRMPLLRNDTYTRISLTRCGASSPPFTFRPVAYVRCRVCHTT